MKDLDFQDFSGDSAFTGAGVDLQGRGEDVIESLNKALSVGYGYALADKTGGGAMRLESLEETMKYVTFTEKAAAMWVAIPKKKAYSTVEEYTTVDEVSGAQFYAEGGVPEEAEDEMKRAYEQVKYVGAIGKLTDTIAIVKTQANAREVVQRNKTRDILREIDKKIFFGDARFNPYEYNGLIRQVETKAKYPTQNIVDLRGKVMNLETLNQACTIIADNYGNTDNIRVWVSNIAKQNYVNELIQNKQLFINAGNTDATMGITADKFTGGNGSGRVDKDVFLGQFPELQPYPRLNSTGASFAATHAKAPDAPTATAAADDLVGSLLAADTYDYAVIAINRFGASLPTEIADVVIAASKKTVFTLADDGSTSGQEATAFRIYRRQGALTLKTDYRYLFTVGVGLTAEDTGEWLPNCHQGMAIDWDSDQVFGVHLLLPMFKKPLAPIGDYEWWLQKSYLTPIVYNANKMVVFKNMGSTSWS